MPKPDFIGIGAQKAATSWLYLTLQKHPEVWLTPSKEIHLFDIPGESSHFKRILKRENGYRKSLNRFKSTDKSNIRWNIKYLFRKRNFDYYFDLFEPKPGQIAGEFTPDYSNISTAKIRQIHREIPDLKIIYILRSPIDRDWSQICMFVKNVLNKKISEVPVKQLLKISKQDHVLKHSKYIENLSRWQSVYAKDKISINFFDAIKVNPRECLVQLYEFLEISKTPKDLMPKNNSYAQTIIEEVHKQIAINEIKNIENIDAYFKNSITSGWLKQAQKLIGT